MNNIGFPFCQESKGRTKPAGSALHYREESDFALRFRFDPFTCQDSDFNATTSAPVSVMVGLSPQSTLTVLAAPTTLSTGGSSQLSSTGGDGTGAVTYEVVNGACSLSGNTLTSAFSGSCAVIATKAADPPGSGCVR